MLCYLHWFRNSWCHLHLIPSLLSLLVSVLLLWGGDTDASCFTDNFIHFFFFYHVSLSEDVDATGVSAKSCYRILKCRKKELTSETTQMNA